MEKLDLKGKWKLRGEFLDVTAERFYEVASKSDGEYCLYKEEKPKYLPSDNGFMEANVPCDVITPLVENGLLKEPLMKANTEDCLWIGDMSWWFIKEFTVTEDMYSHEELRLFIEMLDFNADIIINGIPVAKHKNTFRAYYENVKRFLKVGENCVIIRLTTGYETYYPNDSLTYYGNSKLGQRIYLRKPQFTHGWDWCKPVPTCGIGGDVYIEGVTGAKIDFFRFDTLAATKEEANGRFYLEIENVCMHTADDAVLHVEMKLDGKVVCQWDKELYLAGGVNFVSENVTIPNPSLWWPNGYGCQPLYTVSAWVECRGVRNPMADKKVGIRTIKVNQDKMADGTRKFDFVVNGVKVFCKGGNWVPADSVYLRIPYATYKTLVEEARDCNFTMLRIWGGGLYEPDCFYDLCSENGILVMQDFMYACALYPDYLDWFVHESALEADYQTKRLASQACMAVWTGNNEIHESYTDWYKGKLQAKRLFGSKIFNYVLPQAVKNNSPTIHYMPSSPFYGNKANDILSGDCHMWSWARKPHETGFEFGYELEAFDRMAAKVRFSSEFGFYGALLPSSVERFHEGEEVKMGSKIWTHHGEHDTKRRWILEALNRHVTNTEQLDEKGYLLYSGIMQGILYDEMTTALRRRSHCSGQLIWMYNDCWPETGWTIIDYYLTRKISYYFLKRACEPTKLIVRAIDGLMGIVAVNETPRDRSFTLVYGYMSFDGRKEDESKIAVTIPSHSSWEMEKLPVNHDLDWGFYYAYAEGDSDFQPAVSLRGYYKGKPFAHGNVEVARMKKAEDGMILTVRSDAFVPVVKVELPDDRVKMSDNYFMLLPGIEKEIRVYGSTEEPALTSIKF